MDRIALLTVSMGYVEDHAPTLLVESTLRARAARVAARAWVRPLAAEICTQLERWLASPAIDAVVVCGDAHEHVTASALLPFSDARKPVHVLPAAPSALVDALTRLAVGSASAAPTHVERVPTDKIAVIGDLPPSAAVVMLDLRAGGRRGLWMFAAAAVAIVAAMAGLMVRAGNQETSVAAASEPEEPAPAAAPAPVAVPAPAPAPVPAPVAAPAPAPVPARAAVTTTRPIAHHTPAPQPSTAAAPVDVPPELQAAPDADDDSCTQESCARHHNERECCTPFRDQHVHALDRAAIAHATSAIRTKVRECRDPQASDGVVRVSIEVAPDGSVSSASVLEAPEAGVGQCVANVLRGVTFATTDEGGTFVYRADLTGD